MRAVIVSIFFVIALGACATPGQILSTARVGESRQDIERRLPTYRMPVGIIDERDGNTERVTYLNAHLREPSVADVMSGTVTFADFILIFENDRLRSVTRGPAFRFIVPGAAAAAAPLPLAVVIHAMEQRPDQQLRRFMAAEVVGGWFLDCRRNRYTVLCFTQNRSVRISNERPWPGLHEVDIVRVTYTRTIDGRILGPQVSLPQTPCQPRFTTVQVNGHEPERVGPTGAASVQLVRQLEQGGTLRLSRPVFTMDCTLREETHPIGDFAEAHRRLLEIINQAVPE